MTATPSERAALSPAPPARSRRPRRTRWALGFALLGAALSREARAQTTTDATLAEDLYEHALALEKENKFTEACPKLEESYRLDAQPGSLLALADCFDKTGKTASASVRYHEVLALARHLGRKDREAEALLRLAILEPRLTHLLIKIPPAVAAIPGLEIRRNGALLPRAAWGDAVTVDPEPQSIDVTAPNRIAFHRALPAGEPGSTVDVELPVLAAQVAPTPPTSDAAPGSSGLPLQSILGYSLGGLGAVSTVVGAIFWSRAHSLHASALACRTDPGCQDQPGAASDNTHAQHDALAGNLLVPLGVLALGGGVTLVLTAPSARPAEPPRAALTFAPSLGPGGGRFVLGGVF